MQTCASRGPRPITSLAHVSSTLASPIGLRFTTSSVFIAIAAFVCLLEIHLDLRQAQSLKEKRKLVSSLKAQLRQRFCVAVAEIADHDDRRRGTLLLALVGGREVGARANEVERFIEARCPDGCCFDRNLRSLQDIRD